MSAVGYEGYIPDSVLRHDQENAIHRRARVNKSKEQGLTQYPEQNQHHSLSGVGNRRKGKR